MSSPPFTLNGYRIKVQTDLGNGAYWLRNKPIQQGTCNATFLRKCVQIIEYKLKYLYIIFLWTVFCRYIAAWKL